MPGLQSIVSAWTKINSDHVEYYSENRNGGPFHPRQGQGVVLGPGGIPLEGGVNGHAAAGVPPGAGVGGGVVDHGVGGIGGAIMGGAIDPRTNTYAPSPQMSLPSSSSLSSYSFTKNGGLHSSMGGGTAETNSLTATPPINVNGSGHVSVSASGRQLLHSNSGSQLHGMGSGGIGSMIATGSTPGTHNLSVPPQRYPLHHHVQPQLNAGSSYLSHHQQHQQSLSGRHAAHQPQTHGLAGRHEIAPSLAAHNTAPRIHHRSSASSSRRSHHHHSSSGLHGQLESYHSSSGIPTSNKLDSFPPPPQAGADAILGRRKSHAHGPKGPYLDRADSSLSVSSNNVPLGEPPASLSSNLPRSMSASAAASASGSSTSMSNSAAKRGALTRSHSSSLWHSSSSQKSQSSSTSGAPSVTASLEKMNSTWKHGHGAGPHSAATVDAKTIAEFELTAENALASMNNLTLKQVAANNDVSMQQSHEQHLHQNNLQSQHANLQNASSIMPTPQRSRPKWTHRQKLRKSHSRTDLVREMALDRSSGHVGRTQKHRGSTSSASTMVVRNASQVDELDVSIGSVQQQHEKIGGQQTQQQSQQLGSGSQPIEESNEAMTRSSSGESINDPSDSSIVSREQPFSRFDDPLDRRFDGLNGPMSLQSYNAMGPQQPVGPQQRPGGGLPDGGVPPGGHYMQGWLPSQPLASQRRQSSGGSSATAITGNRTLTLDSGLNSTAGYNTLGSHGKPGAAPPQMKQPPPTTPASANISAVSPLGSKQQQLGANNGSQIPSNSNNCDRCTFLESTLLSLQSDLEYLRTLELQREFVCKECDHHGNNNNTTSLPPIDQKTAYNPTNVMPPPSSGQSVSSAVSIGSRGSRTSSARNLNRRRGAGGNSSLGGATRTHPTNFASRTSMFLRDASKRLSDLSTRHKRQVKQTTHERAYWQNDMHLKLEKFAMMCKNLNEEAAHRSNEVKETNQKLDMMTSERNGLVSMVDTLKARVELYEGESVEQSRLREEWKREKVDMLDSVDRTVKDHDETIEGTSSRLELAVETIESERRQQRMRRQIIFPTTNGTNKSGDHTPSSSSLNPPSPHHYHRSNTTQSSSDHNHTARSMDFDLEFAKKSKDVATKAKMSLKVALVQSSQREKDMQARLNVMERELAEAKRKSMVAATEGAGGMSIRRTSSSASLGL